MGFSFPNQGLNSFALEGEVLTTGSPGTSLDFDFGQFFKSGGKRWKQGRHATLSLQDEMGGGAILGSGAGPCLGDRAEGRGFSSGSQAGEMGFASFAHCITLRVVGSHGWFISMVSYVTQRKADILQVMGKESPQVLTQSSQ